MLIANRRPIKPRCAIFLQRRQASENKTLPRIAPESVKVFYISQSSCGYTDYFRNGFLRISNFFRRLYKKEPNSLKNIISTPTEPILK